MTIQVSVAYLKRKQLYNGAIIQHLSQKRVNWITELSGELPVGEISGWYQKQINAESMTYRR